MKTITKLKLKNFKKFQFLELDFNENLNILIGDNEAGKSTILSAIDLVISGSRNKVEALGLESLFNSFTIKKFMTSSRKFEDLPTLEIEIYLNEQNNHILNGRNNSIVKTCDGVRLICCIDDENSSVVKEILSQDGENFPFEYYLIKFLTFSDQAYSGYRKLFKHVLIDNSQINNNYATRQYVKAMYDGNSSDAERSMHQYEYRKAKDAFRQSVFSELNNRIDNYDFSLKTGSQANLETDLTISEDDINIENKGKGRQCFIKSEFALSRNESDLDFILIEEPENHLSHVKMQKLIHRICASEDKQIFITTHNNLICQRLDLRKAILLNSSGSNPVFLNLLDEETAEFFIKAANHNILEFVLSNKVILVEGDAEYILMEEFYKSVNSTEPAEDDVHIISVGGTSFKRYLEIAKLLKIKTAVLRDNDNDFEENCVNRFDDYVNEHIKVFFEKDNERSTFEKILYLDNKDFCESLFSEGRRTLTVGEYMLNNKTEAALEILSKYKSSFQVPIYISEAISWIKK
jgi:predicted ATP-dependent endonuclease of OLD family